MTCLFQLNNMLYILVLMIKLYIVDDIVVTMECRALLPVQQCIHFNNSAENNSLNPSEFNRFRGIEGGVNVVIIYIGWNLYFGSGKVIPRNRFNLYIIPFNKSLIFFRTFCSVLIAKLCFDCERCKVFCFDRPLQECLIREKIKH